MRFDRPAEGPAPLEPVSTCDPVPKPGVRQVERFIIRHEGGASAGIARACGDGASSKHHEGRALDWTPPSSAAGDRLWNWLLARDAELARRLGLRTVIWDRRMWVSERGVGPYLGASPHTDHVHLGFGWDGALGRTSFFDGVEVSARWRWLPAVVLAAATAAGIYYRGRD